MTIIIEMPFDKDHGEGSVRIRKPDQRELKTIVRETYKRAAAKGSECGCGCSGDDGTYSFMEESYAAKDGYVADADLGLGCGVPTDLAGIKAGDHVLDLGSGAGIDAFIARAIVGEGGSVTGVDFTPEMISLARLNAEKLGYNNVFFIGGDIEALPIPDSAIDVIVSNCVLNLVPDKQVAFAEMARVTAPGGHFCISDIVTRGALPEIIRTTVENYAGCVTGAMDEHDYLTLIADAGFENVTVLRRRVIEIPVSVLREIAVEKDVSSLEGFKGEAAIMSITVRGDMPIGR